MTRTKLTASALAALILTGSVAGTLSAQTVAAETGLTASEAIEIALAEVPGIVTEVELEDEDGELIFEVEIESAEGGEVEIEIAALSGEILEIETEHEDDDNDDDDEEDDDDDQS